MLGKASLPPRSGNFCCRPEKVWDGRRTPESLARLLDFLADARKQVDHQEGFEIIILAGIAQAFAKRGLSLKSWIGNYKLAIRQSFSAAIREAAQTIGQASWSLPLQAATIQLLASGPADRVAQPLEKVLRSHSAKRSVRRPPGHLPI